MGIIKANSKSAQNLSNGDVWTDIATLKNGNIVATWHLNNGADGSGFAAIGRIFAPDGTPKSEEFVINTYTAGDQANPRVTALSDGGFVIVWNSIWQESAGGYNAWGCFGQKFKPDGSKEGNEFQVNTWTNDNQGGPETSALMDGGFAAVWSSYLQDGNGMGIYGQIFDRYGSKSGNEFRVNTTTIGFQESPKIATLSNGNIIITYADNNDDSGATSGRGYLFRVLQKDGKEVVPETKVSTTSLYNHSAQVVALKDSHFALTWTEKGTGSSGKDVYLRIYDSNGKPVSDTTRCNQTSDGDQDRSDIIYLANGNIRVIWESAASNGSFIYQRDFSDVDGRALSEEVSRSTNTGVQRGASITTGTDGTIATAWNLAGSNNNNDGIYLSIDKYPAIRGNSLYTIVDGPSWTQAEANSVKLGGHLVTINDAAENTFLYSNFNTSTLGPWIGIRKESNSKNWSWSSTETSNFTNWAQGEGPVHPSEQYGGLSYQGATQWHSYSNESAQGIAETPFIRHGDSAYAIVQGPTWEEAEANAVKLGGHLVTINDTAENEWIISKYGRGNWIGINDKETEGTFKWSSGESVTYTNWAPNEPSSRPGAGSIQNYGWIQFSNGTWDDLQNDPASNPGYTQLSKGIAEIKLAPNNLPTGTPTLSGTLKASQVITIDKTPIQDSDNFTGYTPDFKYSWEVSSNGTTWTPLTTTDATDNNTTYTLTTAEVGKQVRGVVSYLDGYGTQESVNSAASAAIASSAPAVQSLTLTAPGRTTLRSGTSTTSSIAYNVSTGETALTGIGASLYFDSTQLSVSTAGTPFQNGLLGNAISADTTNADGDLKTDKIFSLTYTDFGGNFPGAGTTLPLTLANLNLVPTASYTGTTLHLKANNPSTGFTATGSDLTLAYNAAPTVNGTIPALTTNRGKAFSYTVPSTLFSDADSTLTLSASTAAGTALPSWLTYNAATRTLSGTPTTGGTLNLNINAADELGSVSAPLTLKVRELQSLSSSTSPLRYQRNKDLTVPINYSTSDGSSSTGLAFKVHYNSSLFSFDPTTGVSNKAQADLFQVGAVQLDTTDSDNDPSTDRYIPINIASFTGQFPSAGAPTKLADLTFRTADKAIDPLTGLRDTSINFSETEAAQGYGFLGSSAALKPLSFSLDVDRDGKVTALGDGLMIIRHLFGAAFAGAALTDKAISPDSPLLGGVAYSSMTPQQKADVAAQVAANIQEGIDSKALDVDKDNKITALGDGLMVIRRLFGAAFDGAALTNKAISPDSPYFGPPADFTTVAANIDALKPTTTTTPVI